MTLGKGRFDKQAVFVTSDGNKATWRVDASPLPLGYATMQVVARAN